METKINYTTVGTVVLVLFGLFILFLIWLGGIGFQQSTKKIDVVFSSVSGLQEGGPVKYQGVNIGSIQKIRINPDNPKEILVLVSVDGKIPIKKDVLASIELQGITGTSFIQFTGGSIEAPEIRKEKGNDYPRVLGRDSSIGKALDSAPGVLNELGSLTTDIKDVVNEENREALRDILSNVKELTNSLKSDSEEGGGDFQETLKNAKSAIKEIELAAKEIRIVFSENRESLKNFGGVGLTALTKFLTEAQQTLATFKRVAESLERSPARFLRNDPEQGVKLR